MVLERTKRGRSHYNTNYANVTINLQLFCGVFENVYVLKLRNTKQNVNDNATSENFMFTISYRNNKQLLKIRQFYAGDAFLSTMRY